MLTLNFLEFYNALYRSLEFPIVSLRPIKYSAKNRSYFYLSPRIFKLNLSMIGSE